MTPVPGLPELGAYPGLVRITTIFVVLPEIVFPDLTALLVTSTPMTAGTVATGGGLVPPLVDHGLPHDAGGVLVGRLTTLAKPLNDDGAEPPLRPFAFDQSLPHHVWLPPPAALRLPTANAPLLGNANTTAVAVAEDGR